MRAPLRRQGYPVNRKRVQRLMGMMGWEAILTPAQDQRGPPAQRGYPYLLRGLAIERPNAGVGG